MVLRHPGVSANRFPWITQSRLNHGPNPPNPPGRKGGQISTGLDINQRLTQASTAKQKNGPISTRPIRPTLHDPGSDLYQKPLPTLTYPIFLVSLFPFPPNPPAPTVAILHSRRFIPPTSLHPQPAAPPTGKPSSGAQLQQYLPGSLTSHLTIYPLE